MRSLTRIILSLMTYFLFATDSFALTIEQFRNICNDFTKQCDKHPTIQAYVGGALDLFASLNETTPYLADLKCQNSQQLYNVGNIISYMQHTQIIDDNANAMTVFIDYFEESEQCD